ncbi:reverse transcriptase family protein (plasmid) [Sphingomonas zeae]
MKRHNDRRYERYPIDASMWAQNPTQQDVASLLGMTKDQLEAIVRDKERYTSRRVLEINGKTRNLAVPTGLLRRVHERIKFQLNKVKQPDYLCSPRKGVGQRDNAERHADGVQLLKIDIRQFYPRTMQEDIWRWAHYTMGIRDDVAGLIAKLVAIDGRMPFGSPVSPVLTTLVHRPMFDQISDLCRARALTMSLWVDDLTISGSEISGDVITEIRQIIRQGGFETHKIEHLTTARPVNITGVPIAGGRVRAPQSLHRRIRDDFAALRLAKTDNERSALIDRLLSALGTYRYHLGASTKEGRSAADRMHALKQRRARMSITAVTAASSKLTSKASTTSTLPWD